MSYQKSEGETPGAATTWTGSLCLLGSVMVWVKEVDSVDILQEKPLFFFETQFEEWSGVNLFSAPHTLRIFIAMEAFASASQIWWMASNNALLGFMNKAFSGPRPGTIEPDEWH